VPVFGVATAGAFKLYRLEYGEGASPNEWHPIRVSHTPQTVDPWAAGKVKWDANRGAQGNLGDWQTGLTSYAYGRQTANLNGAYTLRLTVEDKSGETAEARVVVTVARVITREVGGIAESCDGRAFLNVPPGGVASPFLLVSIQPLDEVRNPAPTEIALPKAMSLVGRVYEFQPPGLELMKPAALRMQYDAADLIRKTPEGRRIALPEDKLGIYEYHATEQSWRRVPDCRLLTGAKEISVELKGVTPHVAFYAIMADATPPDVPTLDTEAAETEKSKVRLSGKAEPYASVEILDGETVRSVAEVGGEGEFSAPAFPLKEGENVLSARAVDGAGNKSEPSAPVKIVRRLHPPRQAKAVEILGTLKAERDSLYLVRLVGEDSDSRVNTCWARVVSDSDPKGIDLELTETGLQTGVYVATFVVGVKTVLRSTSSRRRARERRSPPWPRRTTPSAQSLSMWTPCPRPRRQSRVEPIRANARTDSREALAPWENGQA